MIQVKTTDEIVMNWNSKWYQDDTVTDFVTGKEWVCVDDIITELKRHACTNPKHIINIIRQLKGIK